MYPMVPQEELDGKTSQQADKLLDQYHDGLVQERCNSIANALE